MCTCLGMEVPLHTRGREGGERERDGREREGGREGTHCLMMSMAEVHTKLWCMLAVDKDPQVQLHCTKACDSV